MVLFSLLRHEGVRLLGLLWADVGASVPHAVLIFRYVSKVKQGLSLELLVGVAFNTHAEVCPAGHSLAASFLHCRFGWLFWTYKSVRYYWLLRILL